MDSNVKATLINASWGAWYPRGTDRLVRSMIHHGWNYDINIWKDRSPDELFVSKFPYTIKASAFNWAVQNGYKRILWMDCSLWAIKDPNKLMEIIDEKGGLFIKSGYNLAQTSGDSDLLWAGRTRFQAEQLPELWSCIFGVNMETEEGKKFFFHFMEAYSYGVFNTPREHGGLSKDPSFLHARQDQTAASWAYYKAGFDCMMEPWEILQPYAKEKEANENTIVLMRGM